MTNAAQELPMGEPSAVLSRLVNLSPGPHRVVTCYIPLSPDSRQRRQHLKRFRERLRAVARRAHDGRSDPLVRQLEADFDRVEQYLEVPSRLPNAGGLAVFACGARNLFDAIALPRVHRARIVVDRSAFVRELVEQGAELGLAYAAVADYRHARFFEVNAFEAIELPGMPGTAGRGGRFRPDLQDSPGWGERHYHNRITRERERHFENVARRLRQLDQARPARGVVLATSASQGPALERFLDRDLTDRLLGRGRLSPGTASPRAVFELTARLRRDHDRQAAREDVVRMRNLLGDRWAVNGVAPSLAALFRGQVRTLLVAGLLERPGYRCGTGRLVVDPRECGGHGPALAVPDVIDDAIEEALRQRVRVVVVTDADAKNVAGLAAILRFR